MILSGFNGFITIIFPMSIWDALYKWTSSPFWKSIISLKDQFVATCGSHHRAIALMSTWSGGELSFTAQSYDFLHFKCDPVPWAKLVWESWSIPRYNFILWPAVLGKLRTRDRLQFLQINHLCVFYWVDEESHNHVFFSCPWASLFWRMIKSWLHLHRRISTINSAIRGLLSGRNNTDSRMRRVSLGIHIYLIWEERNKRVFDNSCNSVSFIFHILQIHFYHLGWLLVFIWWILSLGDSPCFG